MVYMLLAENYIYHYNGSYAGFVGISGLKS